MKEIFDWIQKNVAVSIGGSDDKLAGMKDFRLNIGINLIEKKTNEMGKVTNVTILCENASLKILIGYKMADSETGVIALEECIERFYF